MTVVSVAEYRLFYRALLQKRRIIHESKRFVFDKEMCRGKKKERRRKEEGKKKERRRTIKDMTREREGKHKRALAHMRALAHKRNMTVDWCLTERFAEKRERLAQ